MSEGHFASHPLYQNDSFCGDVTDTLLSHGYGVFQLYQMPSTEADHSEWLLQMTDPERKAKRVLSLGCGVGGMESYWKMFRPELTFELVNISKEQLRRVICDGHKVCANAETYESDGKPFDIVALCYLLGHVELEATLQHALGNLAPHGKLLVYDVFEGTDRFRSDLIYATPSFRQLEVFGTSNDLRFRKVIQGGIPMSSFFAAIAPWAARESSPGLFVFEANE